MIQAKATRRNFPRVHHFLRDLAAESEVRWLEDEERDPEYVAQGRREAMVTLRLGGCRSQLYALVDSGQDLDAMATVVSSWLDAFAVVMRPADALALGVPADLRRVRRVDEGDADWFAWPRQMFDVAGDRRDKLFDAIRDDVLALRARREVKADRREEQWEFNATVKGDAIFGHLYRPPKLRR